MQTKVLSINTDQEAMNTTVPDLAVDSITLLKARSGEI